MNPMPMPIAAEKNDDAVRWRKWERGYRNSSRRTAIRARIALTLLLAGTAAWLGLQLFSMPV